MYIIKKAFLIAPLLLLLFGPAVHAEPMQSSPDQQKKVVKLTKQQQEELSKLQIDILSKKKQLIMKYVEYGVLPKEKGDKILRGLDERYQEMKEHGYVPHWNKMHHHHHHHHHDHDHDD
ncbi:DUF2680 domain-containing protein [Bacillus sp. FJAT-49736]|uniref:DUF2680 domain-containing protein n=1 Tax=Bacillus sp. FJAT-49736 TaxID=2833582 RepID=UPI001BCA5D4E|nr:DUF2680 domain-containing protein [Bacillus sp. FJAT-49736]MBS4174091.1 DUF2680 domain-containing protein [Bacillus sp. FJAT-49736]